MLASILVCAKIRKIFFKLFSSPHATFPTNTSIILYERYFAKNINYDALHCVILNRSAVISPLLDTYILTAFSSSTLKLTFFP
jgi:hypothetical protein